MGAETRDSLRCPRWPQGILSLALLLSCQAEPARPDGSDAAKAPTVHTAFGLPGPWWRAGASAEDFDAGVGACRRQSTAARDAAAGGDALDAAYRAFLACMERDGWTRGRPPG